MHEYATPSGIATCCDCAIRRVDFFTLIHDDCPGGVDILVNRRAACLGPLGRMSWFNFGKLMGGGGGGVSSDGDLWATSMTMVASRSLAVNGKVYRGKEVSMRNGRVYIDGVLHEEAGEEGKGEAGRLAPRFEITVTGDVTGDIECGGGATLTVKGSVDGNVTAENGTVTVNGQCHSVKSESGAVHCGGDVEGNVRSESGAISIAGSIGGSARSESGMIRVMGSTHTSGGSMRTKGGSGRQKKEPRAKRERSSSPRAGRKRSPPRRTARPTDAKAPAAALPPPRVPLPPAPPPSVPPPAKPAVEEA